MHRAAPVPNARRDRREEPTTHGLLIFGTHHGNPNPNSKATDPRIASRRRTSDGSKPHRRRICNFEALIHAKRARIDEVCAPSLGCSRRWKQRRVDTAERLENKNARALKPRKIYKNNS
ncbi:hypothetical protein GW17_00000689 [Ensete ventricosum]|nr:hypothetical protein GW17_00000689 [Ensete ventricosum]RZR76376.1 hypothetical protein BHM03_00001148 [Ensete ventricosum]